MSGGWSEKAKNPLFISACAAPHSSVFLNMSPPKSKTQSKPKATPPPRYNESIPYCEAVLK
jgi:hypothetical protein